MTFDQWAISLLLVLILTFFVWGKYRYDLISLAALLVATFLGLVPFTHAFSGFSHPAVITVAAVLIMSRGLMDSGIVDFIARYLNKVGSNVLLQLAVLLVFVTIASAFMNNVGALALFMPVAIRMARKQERSPSLYLMPLAFGSLLGGMMTLIGTPPNIIISSFRSETLGLEPFGMFQFLPVGGVLTVVGILFLVLLGPLIVPDRKGKVSRDELFDINDYLTQVKIPERSKVTDLRVKELERMTDGDITVVGHIREDERFNNVSMYRSLRANDKLIIRASASDIQELVDATGIMLSESDKLSSEIESNEDIEVTEVSVTASSGLINKTARSLNLRSRFGVNILGIARSTGRIRSTPGNVRFKSGDVLLLQGQESAIQDVVSNFTLLPLESRNLRLGKLSNVALALSIFMLAILLAVFNVLPVEVAFVLGAVLMVFTKRLSLKNMYEAIDWPIIILLGAMIPISAALETTGTADLIAAQMLTLAGQNAPWISLLLIMGVTMGLSNVVNNAAAALLMAPVAIAIASGLSVSYDPFLMGVAISASAAFLTPIGHQSNTLVMGPAGYRFSDYTRLGLPISLIVIAVALPLILMVFPL